LPSKKLLASVSNIGADRLTGDKAEWCVLNSLLLHRARKRPKDVDSRVAFVVKNSESPTIQVGDIVCFCADKNYSLGYLVGCKVSYATWTNTVLEGTTADTDNTLIAEIVVDPVMIITDSVSLFSEWCSDIVCLVH
jgi:hypothetical protein